MKNYIKKEAALLLRNKRMKQNLITVLYWIFFMYFVLADKNMGRISMILWKVTLLPFIIALPGLYISQYFWGIEANFINKTATIPVTFSTILKRKYYECCAMSFMVFLLMIPGVCLKIYTMQILLASFSGAVGVLLFIGFWSSIFNDFQYDLNENTFFNWRGNTGKQYIFSSIVYAIFFAGMFCLAYFVSEKTALIFMSALGFLSVASCRVWISRLSAYYDKNVLAKIEKLYDS